MKCYLFDIDGTLADLSHRLHYIQGETKDWDAFFAACGSDRPIDHICDLAFTLNSSANQIVFVSGRSDAVREQTLCWLETQGLRTNGDNWFREYRPQLYMRKAGDRRPDHVVKLELLAQIKADGWEPIMAFDDRNQVVDMWRANGVPCAQVAPGDF